MLKLTPLPWQQKPWRRLMQYVELDQVPHALLICGAEGIGKNQLAQSFARRLLCVGEQPESCECQCKSCRLMHAGTHPDLMQIVATESGNNITIDQIRKLREVCSLRPQYNGYRIVVLQPADSLNTAAHNALLKTLEEPAKGNVFLLVTARPHQIPATIQSRCQRLEVAVPEATSALNWLKQQLGSDDVESLLNLSGGAPLKALTHSQSSLQQQRKAFYSAWCDLAQHRSDPLRVCEKSASIPLDELIFWIIGWTVDMIRLSSVASTKALINPDLRSSLQAEAEKLELKQLFRFYDHLVQSRSLIDSPVNAQMMLETTLIEWFSLRRNG